MKARDKIHRKTRRQNREEILEDWANIRRWIDDLQHEWAERQDVPKSQKSEDDPHNDE